MSCVTYHRSQITCHVSQFLSFLFFFLLPSGEANRWRVCYQRGLLCLVSACNEQIWVTLLWYLGMPVRKYGSKVTPVGSCSCTENSWTNIALRIRNSIHSLSLDQLQLLLTFGFGGHWSWWCTVLYSWPDPLTRNHFSWHPVLQQTQSREKPLVGAETPGLAGRHHRTCVGAGVNVFL